MKIFATNVILFYLSDKSIKPYFIDGTYKILPHMKEYKALIILMGFNYEKIHIY